MSKIDFELRRAIEADIARGEWSTWATSRPVKQLIMKEAEQELARVLGLPSIPRSGKLSLGWCLKHMAGRVTASPNATVPAVQAIAALSLQREYNMTVFPEAASLVFTLMTHRELITKHGQNHYTYHRGASGAEVTLFDDHWSQLSQAVLAWVMCLTPFDSLIAPRGEHIVRLEARDGRLHCSNGPAALTSMHRTVHALNGVLISDELWLRRGNARLILEITNSEVQRALIEDMGLERFIREAGLEPVHKDETGFLYRVEGKGKHEWERRRGHLCWVHVTCPSTGNDYMLAVPPNTRTAREGVAWTFGKLPEEYQPSVQT